MNGTGGWRKQDFYWIAGIIALCVLVVLGFWIYCRMGARLPEPSKKGARGPTVVAVTHPPLVGHTPISARV